MVICLTCGSAWYEWGEPCCGMPRRGIELPGGELLEPKKEKKELDPEIVMSRIIVNTKGKEQRK